MSTLGLPSPRTADDGGRRRLTIAAMVLLGLPVAALLFLAGAEMLGGEPSGVQHIPEALVLLALMGVAWRFPRAAGIVLLTLGAVVFVAWLALVFTRANVEADNLPVWIAAAFLLPLPPLVAGWLLLRASQRSE